MITTEVKDISQTEHAEVEIYLDHEGLGLLLKELKILEAKGGHVHFMTPAWAGNELSEEKVGAENTLINHLCIILKQD
ncbi:conserved hypothetical protein [Desulfatibacillum aliphaticivorans]|uniref:Uncharacterized protein n=1 Tax=Desulfatibacillum aliphaticivorans TaxID=218208 RepID=B8FKR9_DESAL|nr:Imm32 family immunity protein [Desulfatibacillum aliphaticivorans]ACL04441.1 conserved hypothetical protein [Desulfatibacillum aliphaticivorans]